VVWIESHEELARHPKVLKAARMLQTSVPAVIGHLHCLWWWAMSYAPDGDLTRYDDGDLAAAMLWEGEPRELVAALTEVRLLDDERVIHDWPEYAGRIIEKRRADADRLRAYRQANKDETRTSDNRTSDVQRTNAVTVPNRTVPNRTGPETPPPYPPQGGEKLRTPDETRTSGVRGAKRGRPPRTYVLPEGFVVAWNHPDAIADRAAHGAPEPQA
jgi:hypothetical protein